MNYYDCINISSCLVDKPVLLPIEAENQEMAKLWLRCFNAEYATWYNNPLLTGELKPFDAQQQVFWIELPPVDLVFGIIINAARACYKELQRLHSEWNFSCLYDNNRLKSIAQTSYEPIELHFRGWEIDQNIENFILDEFNNAYTDYDQEGGYSSFIETGRYETEGRFGEKINVVVVNNYNCPSSPSILFELGLKLADKINLLKKSAFAAETNQTATLSQHKIMVQTRIQELQGKSISDMSSEDKFELKVLELLEKCDTTRELDLLREKTAAVAPNSSITNKLLALIQTKRDLFQL